VAVGNVLLSVHERHVTTVYVGEGIVRTGDTGFLTKVDDVVGDDRKLTGEYGSYHPESVQEVDGQAFGFDIFNGVVWRYTVEGIFAISEYGMKSFFRDKARDYFDQKDKLKFVSSIDRYHKEYLLTLPVRYETYLASPIQNYTGSTGTYDYNLTPSDYQIGDTYRLAIFINKQNGADSNFKVTVSVSDNGTTVIKDNIIIDVITDLQQDVKQVNVEFKYTGQSFIRIAISGIAHSIFAQYFIDRQRIKGETWAFNYEKKVWTQRYSYVPEFMGKVGNELLSFKNGNLYRHNSSDVHNNFYGEQYESSFTVVCNPQPNKVKVWSALQIAAMSLCADEAGTSKVMECTNDQGQASYTRAKDFKKRQGVYYAPILRDVNTNPLLLSAGKIALRDGKDMTSKTLEITIHNDREDQSLLQKLNIIGEFSEFSI
jgi:hypothetical protein